VVGDYLCLRDAGVIGPEQLRSNVVGIDVFAELDVTLT
jgi:hypothetical protein